jgi:hypothetical protein
MHKIKSPSTTKKKKTKKKKKKKKKKKRKEEESKVFQKNKTKLCTSTLYSSLECRYWMLFFFSFFFFG